MTFKRAALVVVLQVLRTATLDNVCGKERSLICSVGECETVLAQGQKLGINGCQEIVDARY